MAIDVDVRSVRRQWYQPGGHLPVLGPGRLARRVAATRGAHADRGRGSARNSQQASTRSTSEGWVLVKTGWTGVLVNAYGFDQVMEWFGLFQKSWQGAFVGRIAGEWLVEASDLAPWCAHDQINPDVLAVAREGSAR